MAGNPNPSPKTRFQPGNNANPKGAATHTTRKLKKAFTELTEAEVVRVMNMIITCPPEELQREAAEQPTMLKQIIASAMAKSVKNGDMSQLMVALERMFGKPKQRVEMSGPHGGAIRTSELTEEEKLQEKERLDELLKMHKDLAQR